MQKVKVIVWTNKFVNATREYRRQMNDEIYLRMIRQADEFIRNTVRTDYLQELVTIKRHCPECGGEILLEKKSDKVAYLF